MFMKRNLTSVGSAQTCVTDTKVKREELLVHLEQPVLLYICC